MHNTKTKFLKKLHHECQSRDTDIIFTYSDIVYMCIYRRQLKKVYRSTAYVLQNIAKQQPCTKLQSYHEQVYIRVLKIIIIKKPLHFFKFPIKIYIHIFAVLTSCNVWRRSQKYVFKAKHMTCLHSYSCTSVNHTVQMCTLDDKIFYRFRPYMYLRTNQVQYCELL